MNEIIQFKPRKKSSLGEALYEKLEGGWKLLQIASPKSLQFLRLNAAGRDSVRDLFDYDRLHARKFPFAEQLRLLTNDP